MGKQIYKLIAFYLRELTGITITFSGWFIVYVRVLNENNLNVWNEVQDL